MVELSGRRSGEQASEEEIAKQIGSALIGLSLKLPEWGEVPDRRLMEGDKLRELMVQLVEARLDTAAEYGARGSRTTSFSYLAAALSKEIVIEAACWPCCATTTI